MNPITPLSRKKGLIIVVVASLLLHFLVLFILSVVMTQIDKSLPEPAPVWVELKKMDSPRQIADIPKPKREEKPDKADAVSMYDQKVKDEIVKQGMEQQSASVKPSPLKPEPDSRKLVKMPGLPEARKEMPATLVPDDFLPDYKWGNRTYINTLAQPNMAYFVELKRKYRLTWNPAPILRGHANEISRGKISVVLGVSVNSRGELADLVVIRSSGYYDYDQEGKRTIRSSSPYSAPAANLLGADHLLHMAWTFVVYL